MLSRIQKYVLRNGDFLKDHLENKYQNFDYKWNHDKNIVEFIAHIPKLKSPVIFRWVVDGDNIYSINGKAIMITPELDKGKIEQEQRKNEIQVEYLRIYNFLRQKWNELSERDGDYIPENHDAEVFKSAKEEFGLNEDEVYAIYLKVEKKLYNIE